MTSSSLVVLGIFFGFSRQAQSWSFSSPRLQSHAKTDRRGFLTWSLASATATVVGRIPAANAATQQEHVTVPLTFNDFELLVSYQVDGHTFQAAVDTGSPFLMIPANSAAAVVPTKINDESAMTRSFLGQPSGLDDTMEQFDGFQGTFTWRKASFAFVDDRHNSNNVQQDSDSNLVLANDRAAIFDLPQITFGVADQGITNGNGGGVFLGLIRDTEEWVRPSFLSQTDFRSFTLDLRNPYDRTLTLSRVPVNPTITDIKSNNVGNTADFVPLANLRKLYNDPASHYTTKAKRLLVDGKDVTAGDGKPIYAIIDTGTTGMLVSRELYAQRTQAVHDRQAKCPWGNVEVELPTVRGRSVSLTAHKPLALPCDAERTCKKFDGHLIVLGLSFLDGNKIAIDIDQQTMWIENGTSNYDYFNGNRT